MATCRHLELRRILLWDRERITICTSLIRPNHTNIILYYNAFGSLAGIIPIGEQTICTWAILVILAAILDLVSRWPPNITLTPQTDSSRKVSGIRGITQVSVLHWSKSRNATNPRWPPDAILDYKKAYTQNDRESSVLDSMHFQATFLKKNPTFWNFAHFCSYAPGLITRFTPNKRSHGYDVGWMKIKTFGSCLINSSRPGDACMRL